MRSTAAVVRGWVGVASHLASELFKEEAKIDILHVPYKGAEAEQNQSLT